MQVDTTVNDSTDSWSYGTNTWRPADNSTTMRVSFVTGLQEDSCFFLQMGLVTAGASSGGIGGVGIDSTTAPSGVFVELTGAQTGMAYGRAGGSYLGFHYAQGTPFWPLSVSW